MPEVGENRLSGGRVNCNHAMTNFHKERRLRLTRAKPMDSLTPTCVGLGRMN